jgi:hypothetical protein
MGAFRVEQLLANITRPSLEKRGFASHRLITEWVSIAGEEAARYSLPQKLVFTGPDSNDGVLHIAVESGWALILQHYEPVILERIATYFGYRAVSRLVFHQQPLPVAPSTQRPPSRPLMPEEVQHLEKQLESVTDETLHRTLKEIGQSVMRRSKTMR